MRCASKLKLYFYFLFNGSVLSPDAVPSLHILVIMKFLLETYDELNNIYMFTSLEVFLGK